MPRVEVSCKNCGKTFEAERSQGRKFCSSRCVAQFNIKMGVFGKGRPRNRISENLNITSPRGETHDEEIRIHAELLQREGFRCIPSGLENFPAPDIIAIKKGKVYAIEIHRSRIPPSSSILGKYDELECFDDIMWIWVKGSFPRPHNQPHRPQNRKV